MTLMMVAPMVVIMVVAMKGMFPNKILNGVILWSRSQSLSAVLL